MPERSADWMRQAEKDLIVAQKMHQDGIHEWSCFIAQQAAEKAIKSVYQKNGGTAWGHSLKELFEGLKKRIDIPQSLEKDAGTLDKYYVPARYPNGFGAGAPFEYFTNEDSVMRSAVQEESYNSVKVFWLDSAYVLNQLMVRIDAIAPDPNVLKVILFGSFAEGRAVPGSDVDILIVLNRDSRRIMDRIPEFQEKFSGIGIGIDIFAYTVDELDNPLVKNAMASGKVLFERKSHLNG